MTASVIGAGLALAISALSTPALSTSAHDSMMATPSRVTLAAWTARVEDELDRQIAYPNFLAARDLTGTVRVKFNCSESGRPASVGVDKSSGSKLLDRAAVHAVERIVTLHPLPTGMLGTQKYVAVVMFGTSDDADWKRDQIRMRADAHKQSSWFKDAPEQVASRLP